jgi:hypothetical protein
MPTDAELQAARTTALDEILESTESLKLIVAGAGTGKTHAFKELLGRCEGPALALTFLVMLVRDLREALDDEIDVHSFHGFAKKLLHSMDVVGVTQSVSYYPAVDQIYSKDISITDRSTSPSDVSSALVNLDDDGVVLPGVIRSGDYYNCVGHSDSVYRVFRALEANAALIPRYSQLVVDEYQDFNLLEVSLIKLLSDVSPTLVVGDDDQALYGFKDASAKYIRELATGGIYTRFDLPFCSRCTSVLIDAVHRVVVAAQSRGLLQDRITKRYECFLPDKRTDSTSYPKIIHARCTVENRRCPYIGRYIERRLSEITPEEIAESHAGGYPTVLVIGPKEFARTAFQYLESRLPNVEYRIGSSLSVAPLDGYRRLMRDEASRLGWRILLELDVPPGWESWVRSALIDGAELSDLIDDAYRTSRLEIVELLERVKDGEAISSEESRLLEGATGLNSAALAEALGTLDEIADEDDEGEETTEETPDQQPTVLVTSLLGAKGLQAGHVFLVGVTDRHFPRNNGAPTDDEVCQLIVALTRARKSCTLVSVGRFGSEVVSQSVFISWLSPLLETVQVNKTFLDQSRN